MKQSDLYYMAATTAACPGCWHMPKALQRMISDVRGYMHGSKISGLEAGALPCSTMILISTTKQNRRLVLSCCAYTGAPPRTSSSTRDLGNIGLACVT
jgi:hypothetical protein